MDPFIVLLLISVLPHLTFYLTYFI